MATGPIDGIGKKSYSIASDRYNDFKTNFTPKKVIQKLGLLSNNQKNSIFVVDGNLGSHTSAASAQ